MRSLAVMEQKRRMPLIETCRSCHWFEPCGGFRDRLGLFGDTCFDRHCCGGNTECNHLCPENPKFIQMLNEVRGLRFESLPEFRQSPVELPTYVPCLLHRSSRERRLRANVVAIPLESVLHSRRTRMVSVARDAIGLREYLRLRADVRIVLNCIRPDEPIERLWSYWVQDDIPAKLRILGIDTVIAPNYSHFEGAPRLSSVGNRMRQLIAAADMIEAGMNVVPHLSVIDPQDWEFWEKWLKENSTVRAVAFEFETGYKTQAEGLDAIKRLAGLQQAAGRELRLLVVGGTQFRHEVRTVFKAPIFISSFPFWNATHRQQGKLAAGQLKWTQRETEAGEPIDDILQNNIDIYSEWMEQ